PLSVDRQDPRRQEARVEGEEARRVTDRGFDVAPRVADDECVPVEDLDQVVAHDPPPPGAAAARGGEGNRRWKRTSRPHSPSIVTAPRRTAATAFASPRAIASNRARGARSVQSAAPFRCDTVTSPLSTPTSQRSLL